MVLYLKRVLSELARQGIEDASNGGCVNPAACKRTLEAAITELGLSLKVDVPASWAEALAAA